jgi:hypothetical protein
MARQTDSVIDRISGRISPQQLHQLQRQQYKHDLRNHFDILSLHKTARLIHYGLHFSKYVGRLARGATETISVERTIIDTFLVSLSAANTLHQDLSKTTSTIGVTRRNVDALLEFADAAGRFADACEKIDHLEDFLSIARDANRDIIRWVLTTAEDRNLDLESAIKMRRAELASRQFYIED